ncbi:MAG: hypothetical protein ACYDAA_08380 [Syntrophales bacterium]
MGPKRSACFILLLAACLGTAACTHQLFRDFGRISLNDEATRAFDSYSVNADFHYYISGSDTYPNAIIGLHRDYRIDPESLWKKVEMTPEVMQKIVSSMKENSSTRQHFLYGYELLGPKGQPLGVWYSIQTARTCLQMKDAVTVRIDTPDIDTYKHLNGEMGMTLESG